MARWIRPATRRAIYERDGWTCAHCGEDLHEADERMRTLDHVICANAGRYENRLARNGVDNRPTNLVLACLPCNARRGNTPLEDLSLTVQARIARRISTPLRKAA
jgi:5-methylcytosine-specific restriction endonuclease McrA